MTTNVILSAGYYDVIAERGKFAKIDDAFLATEGLTGSSGRYAVLTYDIAEPFPVSSIDIAPTNNISILSRTLTADEVVYVAGSSYFNEIEVQNRSGGSIFYAPVSTTTISEISAIGMILTDGAMYTADRKLTGFSIGALSAGLVSMFGYTYQ